MVASTRGHMSLMRTVNALDFVRLKTTTAASKHRDSLKQPKHSPQEQIALCSWVEYLKRLRKDATSDEKEGTLINPRDEHNRFAT